MVTHGRPGVTLLVKSFEEKKKKDKKERASDPSTMTAKTLEKVPVNLGGFGHPGAESVYSVDDIATSLPTSVAIFPNTDLGAHYDQINVGAGKMTLRLDTAHSSIKSCIS